MGALRRCPAPTSSSWARSTRPRPRRAKPSWRRPGLSWLATTSGWAAAAAPPRGAPPPQARREAARPIVVGDNVWLGGARRPAVLRPPDVFHAAVGGDPVIDC